MANNGIAVFDVKGEGRSTFQSANDQAIADYMGAPAPDYLGQAPAPAPTKEEAAAVLDRASATLTATGVPGLQKQAVALQAKADELRGEKKILGFKRKHVIAAGVGLAAAWLLCCKR